MAITLDYGSSTLSAGLSDLSLKIKAGVLMYAATKAAQIDGRMKVNRPWTDRTGEAKRQLTVKVSQPTQDLLRLTLAHGVDYGIWLELANEKKYAIIQPTVIQEGPMIVADLKNLMNTL